MKSKFYTSLLFGIGLTLATTTSYAKPTQLKHASVSVKRVKINSRRASANHTPSSKKKHFSNASSEWKKSGLQSISIAKYADRRSPSISARNSFLSQKIQGESLIQAIGNNNRIRSIIVSDNKRDIIDNTVNDKIYHRITSVHGTVNSSLSMSGRKAGLPDNLIMQLINIFAWDIDFATNLHYNDQFTVVYEETGIGNDLKDSQIIAAEFVNQGRILTAIRYKDNEGNINYYSPEGRPMRKAFLSAPVDFVRISSGFDTHRKHPILNRIRAHKGVDYAARTGTPVKSAGDGEIVFCGRKGGYGQVIVVKHGEHYETLYAHLANFKKGLKPGAQVRQGEVIGYVGQTGLATGPHLHYEFRIDGVHRNPETLHLAQSLPLQAELLADFKSQTQLVLDQLNQTKARSLFAINQYN
ncbi:MAG: peptidoglycan DD-metalloendopeptidase family protein [Methylococcales bacterium]|nr:peptidoglycan DD-metalloendopeptidase family protein [Methylococcales bacterium]